LAPLSITAFQRLHVDQQIVCGIPSPTPQSGDIINVDVLDLRGFHGDTSATATSAVLQSRARTEIARRSLAIGIEQCATALA
jgi:methionine aminopeptidase